MSLRDLYTETCSNVKIFNRKSLKYYGNVESFDEIVAMFSLVSFAIYLSLMGKKYVQIFIIIC